MSRKNDAMSLLKRAVELVMPDLRHYYRIVHKGRIEKSYASTDGNYWADVRPLRNDESVDESAPVIPQVEIPILWAGEQRGVVCPPAVGMLCDIEYYDGDPAFPRIGNFRWPRGKAPACELGAFIIQQADGISIKIDVDGNILTVTAADITQAGANITIEATGDVAITAGGNATVKASAIDLNGGGALDGIVNGLCTCAFTGAPHPVKSSTVKASM